MSNISFYKVGGAVRDQLLGLPVVDVDWVVVGADVDYMLASGYQAVGADFPVFLHPKTREEYALARTERKSGKGYGGFSFYAASDVTLEEDLARRDLTINAIAQDKEGNLYDPYHGLQDLHDKILRHVSPAFSEDPLRVLRVARFAARYAKYGFIVAPETLALMQQLSLRGELQELTAERIWKEFSRALQDSNPEVFLEVLADCQALYQLMPDIIEDMPYITKALQYADQLSQPLFVRWACLFVGLSNRNQVSSIEYINTHFKVPNDCHELATLVGLYLSVCKSALILSAEDLLDFLLKVDVLRRSERLQSLLQVCLIDNLIAKKTNIPTVDVCLPIELINRLALSVKEVSVEPFIRQGLKGAQIGDALYAERLQKVSQIIKDYK